MRISNNGAFVTGEDLVSKPSNEVEAQQEGAAGSSHERESGGCRKCEKHGARYRKRRQRERTRDTGGDVQRNAPGKSEDRNGPSGTFVPALRGLKDQYEGGFNSWRINISQRIASIYARYFTFCNLHDI